VPGVTREPESTLATGADNAVHTCRVLETPAVTAWRLESTLWTALMVASAAAADPPRVTVALEASGVDASAALERLAREGFVVVAPGAAADVHIRAVAAGAQVEVQCQSGRVTRTRRVLPADLAETVADMAKEPQPASPSEPPADAPPAPEPPVPEVATPEPAPVEPEPAPVVRRTTLSLGASALWRGVADPSVSLAIRRGGPLGLGLAGEVDFTPSVGPGISVQETAVLVGASYRWELRRGVDLDAGGRIGLVARYDSLSNPQTLPASSWDATLLVLAPVEIISWLSPKTSFGMRLAPGIAASSPSLVDGGAELWFRRIFRLEAGVSLQHTF
jgi:hypothetical protein